MPSAIDPANPTAGAATTASVRDNFSAAKSEIEALQTDVAAAQSDADAAAAAAAAAQGDASAALAAIAARVQPGVGNRSPVDSSGDGMTLSTAVGTYIKIGRLIIAQCRISFGTIAVNSPVAIGGLPFAADNTDAIQQGTLSVSTRSGTTNAAMLKNTSTFTMYGSTGTRQTNGSLSNNTFYCQLIYTTP
jgi:hypothetical protein